MFNSQRDVLGLTWLFIIFVIPLPFISALSAGLPAAVNTETIAIYWGAMAYAWMLSLIYLGTRPKWLDRLIGLPDMYVLHGIMGVAVVVLAYLHKSGAPSYGLIRQTGDWSFDILLGILLYSLVFMAGWLTTRITLLRLIKQRLETLFKHEVSVWLHRLNLVATALVFLHVQLISYVTAITPFMVLFDGSTLFVAGAYLWYLFSRRDILRGTLESNTALSPNVTQLVISIAKRAKVDIRPGDYLFLSFPTMAGLREPHPFSVVSFSQETGQLTFAIRGDGDFSTQIAQVAAQTPVDLAGGYGRFAPMTSDHPDADSLILIGGGIGVTPLLSLIEAHPEKHIQLFYSAHQAKDLLYQKQLATWQAERPNFQAKVQTGRFSDADIFDALPANWRQSSLVLVSGPTNMIRYYRRRMRQAGGSPASFYAEEFTW